MLPKENRLRHEKDIQALFANGKGVFGIYLSLKFKKNNLSDSRFAMVAGVKVSKKAVVRNRLKRQVRAIVHTHLESIARGFDVAILIRKEAVGKNSEEFEKDLLKMLKKAKLLS